MSEQKGPFVMYVCYFKMSVVQTSCFHLSPPTHYPRIVHRYSPKDNGAHDKA